MYSSIGDTLEATRKNMEPVSQKRAGIFMFIGALLIIGFFLMARLMWHLHIESHRVINYEHFLNKIDNKNSP